MSGPLDEMLAEVRAAERQDTPPFAALRSEEAAGTMLTLVVFRSALTSSQLRQAIEGTLLSLLSEPVTAYGLTHPKALRVVFSPDTADGSEPSSQPEPSLELERFLLSSGFTRADLAEGTLNRAAFAETLKQVRGEASRLGLAVPDQLEHVYLLPCETAETPLTQTQRIPAVAEGPQTVPEDLSLWGEEPGALYRALEAKLKQPLPTGDALLTRLDNLTAFASRPAAGLRWLPPQTFLGLCDLVGVAASVGLGAPLSWPSGDRDEAGNPPPPVLGLHTSGSDQPDSFIPVGLYLLRRLILPAAFSSDQDHRTSPISSWVNNTFGAS